MAMLIVEECISCGACEPECPNTAIAAGDSIFVINPDLCQECEGAFDTPQDAGVKFAIIDPPGIQFKQVFENLQCGCMLMGIGKTARCQLIFFDRPVSVARPLK